jgi:hypothetical protein
MYVAFIAWRQLCFIPTLYTAIRARGAIPLIVVATVVGQVLGRPVTCTPQLPAAMLATCVPCPLISL